jgi:cytochrome c oxidase assembly protein subunit 15
MNTLTQKSSSHRTVMTWLFAMASLVFIIIIVGGITRLTGSGLSMVEWRPLMGILPPMREAEWVRVYTLYQASPEYIQINFGMNLAEFKTIFFWEYIHRILGRLTGFAFTIPLIIFAVRKMIPQGYGMRLSILLVLGGMQGVIGWWMVKSGLVNDPEVSQYRLAIHLSMALIILALLVWTGLDLKNGRAPAPKGHVAGVVAVLAITIVAGAFVAGMDAGKLYTEYPLMGDGFIPFEYGQEGAMDAFENPASAQFNHRILALLVMISMVTLWWRAVKSGLALRGHLMLGAVCAQFILGIMTLLYAVPVSLGTLHQAGAATVLILTVAVAHGLSLKANAKRDS